MDKLWLYNLHYFDDLNAAGAAERRNWHRVLINRWIAENPPGYGNGWEPYPLSLRIVNWIQWARAGNSLEPAWLHSLAVQTRYLARRLEHHLLGNHLFANAKALIYAGLFFAGPEADRWLRTGLRLLGRELPEQILNDGGHFERSPMYHAILLKDLLDLLNLATALDPHPQARGDNPFSPWTRRGGAQRRGGSIPRADGRAIARRMLGWLQAMTHPDGDIAFFNDAAFGIAPPLAQLADYAGRLGILFTCDLSPLTSPLTPLPASGYLRLEAGPAVLILDAGPVGPDYLPGHAHADTLSFELSLHGQRILVNSGISCYGTSPERQRQRGTAAHNTVVVDGQDSSEVWGGFRVARRARPVGLRWGEARDGLWVECAHDGYRRLPGRVTHWRRWQLTADHLSIHDRLSGDFRHALACYHLHPAVRVELNADGRSGILQLLSGTMMTFHLTPGPARLLPGAWRPRFGASEANQCLEIPFNGPQAQFTLKW
jgi:uncharacterized heparinase superfamily protein